MCERVVRMCDVSNRALSEDSTVRGALWDISITLLVGLYQCDMIVKGRFSLSRLFPFLTKRQGSPVFLDTFSLSFTNSAGNMKL